MAKKATSSRIRIFFWGILTCLLTIQGRLFYWQIIKGQSLKIQAQQQTWQTHQLTGDRGQIFTADGHLLVGNQPVYNLFLNKNELTTDCLSLTEQLPAMIAQDLNWQASLRATATSSGNLITPSSTSAPNPELVTALLINKCQSKANWLSLVSQLTPETATSINDLNIAGLHLIETSRRYYPEASLAAHLLGFVAQNEAGENLGYFGLEGALNAELKGLNREFIVKKDALGLRLADQKMDFGSLNGRDVWLTISRQIQYLVETELKLGIEKYQAKKGEIIILEPATGKILALATWPTYDLTNFQNSATAVFKNPALADLYEPGSTFKTLTVAAGIDSGVITPDTPCPNCTGPRVIGGYTIRTWNDEYHPQISITDALVKSDNVAMIFVAQTLGADKFMSYLEKFGLGQELDLDLQEDTKTPLPAKLGPVELATVSFGQGISLNSLQLLRAVGAIANHGLMMKPYLVDRVYDPQTGETTSYQPQAINQVIKPETASQVTEMMVKAAQKGEAQWIGKNYLVAGKTGTSQIPSSDGGYLEEATIASFIGFAPPANPRYLMLVKLVEPQSSPWAAETAAPLWFKIAQKLSLIFPE